MNELDRCHPKVVSKQVFRGARESSRFHWGILGLLLLWLGCGILPRREESGPGVTKADYERSCGGCHQAYKPKIKSDDEWQEFVSKHRFLSGHDAETAQLFADYLKRNN